MGDNINMTNDKIQTSIEVNGRAIRCYQHDGRVYLESREDVTYAIRVKNKTGGRIKAVIGVDGLSILTGKIATDKPDEMGYILQPYEEQVFKGYRVDNDTVAEFKFVKRERSYATEAGNGPGNGVIAVRAYTEKDNTAQRLKDLQEKFDEFRRRQPEKEFIPYPVWPKYPGRYDPYWGHLLGETWYAASMGSSTCGDQMTYNSSLGDLDQPTFNAGMNKIKMDGDLSAHIVPQGFNHGSAWGAAIKDSVKTVQFEVGEFLAEETFYYASLDSLKEMGIDVTRAKQVALPQAFKQEYCAKPSGWHG